MVHLPDRLPAREADLADWSVYADELQREGDPLGELIAHELALPNVPTPDQLKAFRALVDARCWRRKAPGFLAAWSLGQIYELMLEPKQPRVIASIDDTLIAATCALFASPETSRLAKLYLQFSPSTRTNWAQLFAALPVTCTHVTAAPTTDGLVFDVRAFIAAMPAHVRHLALTPSRADECDAISDQFDTVYFRTTTEPRWDGIDRALTRTSRVHVLVDRAPIDRLSERVRLASDVGLIDVRGRRAFAFAERDEAIAAAREGLLPIRARLARAGNESHALPELGVLRTRSQWVGMPNPSSSSPSARHALYLQTVMHDNETYRFNGGPWLFCERDLTARAKAL
ncbi:MAG: hypothetical protein QM831_01680 [Kofleriaceae bacterium]